MKSRSVGRRTVVVALVGLLLAAQAAPASATVSVAPNGLVTGDDAADRIEVGCVDGLLEASGVTAGESCAAVTDLLVAPGGGADQVLIGAVTSSAFPALRRPRVDVRERVPDPRPGDVVSGSSFGDLIEGDWRDHLLGGEGDDVIIGGLEPNGGPGDDVMEGAALRAFGGDGDDRFVDTLVVEGGPGVDTWDAHFEVLLAGTDLPHAYIYTPDGLYFGDISAGAGWGGGVERVSLTLLPYAVESYDGSRFGGPQTVHGLAGVDTLVGGPAADALFAGPGDDVVDGRGGADVVDLGEGDDAARTRDGLVDVVSCGPGTDFVAADAVDELVGCEKVSVPHPRTNRIRGRSAWAKPIVARFVLSSPTPGVTFQCKLDGRRWKRCSSRPKVRTARLETGSHTLRARAVLVGVADRTPSVKRFRVMGHLARPFGPPRAKQRAAPAGVPPTPGGVPCAPASSSHTSGCTSSEPVPSTVGPGGRWGLAAH